MGQVVAQSELNSRRGGWKRAGKGVVCASGCFDLLHPGHIRLLERARSLGDILVVAVESDAGARARSHSLHVPAKNGPSRPITPATERTEILAALAAVDYVVEYDGVSPRAIFAQMLPDVIVLGGSSAGGSGADEFDQHELDELEALGCKIVRVALEPGYSTAGLIERIWEVRA